MANTKPVKTTQNTNDEIAVVINDLHPSLFVSQNESLLNALRRAGYFSVKYGCGDGTCGVCSVLVNGKPVKSCAIKAVDVRNAEITTIEGLGQNDEIDPIQSAFMETGAIQCGYCTPAQILSAKSLLNKNPIRMKMKFAKR